MHHGLSDLEDNTQHWVRSGLRKLFASNPFYPLSAALLLYGVYHVSVHSDFLVGLSNKLVFNFSALQVYEVLILVTAVVLARAKIWYESLLLISLENLLVLVPFVLLNLAVFIDPLIGWTIGGLGGAFAVIRFCGFKHLIPRLNLPTSLLVVGIPFLLANMLLPLLIATLRISDSPFLARTILNCWIYGLPTLLILANLLPRPKNRAGNLVEQRWIPSLFFSLWVLVTAVHLWIIGFIYDLEWHPYFATPLIWTCTWTAFYRSTDSALFRTDSSRQTLLCFPALSTLLAMYGADAEMFCVLSLLNAPLYGLVWFFNRNYSIAKHLILISLAAVIVGIPEDLAGHFLRRPNRTFWTVAGISFYCMLAALFSRNPRLGFVGALSVVVGTVLLGESRSLFPSYTHGYVGHLAFQGGLVFLILHSLWWDDVGEKGAAAVRTFFSLVWVFYSVVWVVTTNDPSVFITSGFAGLVILWYVIAGLLRRTWKPLIVPFAAILVLCAWPVRVTINLTDDLLRVIPKIPTSVLALLASFALFGIGTWIAFWRQKQHLPVKVDNDVHDDESS